MDGSWLEFAAELDPVRFRGKRRSIAGAAEC
jgi:hypothetical protein